MITRPQLDDVVDPNWGDQITDAINLGSFATFTSTALRTAAIPAPPDGGYSYLNSNDALEGPYWYNGVAYRLPWNMPWGTVAANGGGGALTTSAATELALYAGPTFNCPGNRRYRITFDCTGQGSVAADFFKIMVRRGSGTGGTLVHVGSGWTVPSAAANAPITVIAYDVPAASATQQYTTTVVRVSGTGAFTMVNSASFESDMYVDDIGPAGGAPT